MSVTDKQLRRINELAAIAKKRQLTIEEATERTQLRAAYIAAVKENLKSQLDAISVVAEDGSKKPLKKKKK